MSKFLNLLAISTVAIFASSLGVAPVVALDTAGHQNVARVNHAHSGFAKKKKRAPKRCQNRAVSSSIVVDTATSSPVAVVTPAPAAETPAPAAQTPAPAPAPAPVTPAPSTPISSVKGKVGIAWNNPEYLNVCDFVTSRTGYSYTWSPWAPPGASKCGLKVAPMLWSTKQIGDWNNLVKAGYSDVALGFNEPDQEGQSNIDAQTAANLWRQHLQPLKALGYRLGSPATTNSPAGIQWMKDFFAACSDCTIDFVAIHWYSTSAQDFINHVNMMHDTFGRNIWVTEYACQNFGGGAQCSKSEIASFTDTVINFLDNAYFVEQYFPFGFLADMYNVNYDNQLVSGSSVNDLGRKYIGY